MIDPESIEGLKIKYEALCHAMQTGVAYHLQFAPEGGTPKHLRVGVNIALRGHGSLVELLIEKGVITELEYWQAATRDMEREVADYIKLLQAHYGSNIEIKLV